MGGLLCGLVTIDDGPSGSELIGSGEADAFGVIIWIPCNAGPEETGRLHREAMPLSDAVCRCVCYRGGKVKGERFDKVVGAPDNRISVLYEQVLTSRGIFRPFPILELGHNRSPTENYSIAAGRVPCLGLIDLPVSAEGQGKRCGCRNL